MISLKIVTPSKIFLETEVKQIIVRGIEGDLAVMRGTQPIITPTKISNLKITMADGVEKEAAISEGYLSVEPEITTLVVESAEWPEDIDIIRAEEAKKRAEERLFGKLEEEPDYIRAKTALSRAINRIHLIKKD
ncbi:MAG: ATP synthase F1 subunit epsilon [Tissierellia bacterium]|nr:ATP synthase F1 subunit epsilon [Tissierellia bacterium]